MVRSESLFLLSHRDTSPFAQDQGMFGGFVLEVIVDPIALKRPAEKVEVRLAILHAVFDFALAQNGRTTRVMPGLDVPIRFDPLDDFVEHFLDRLLLFLWQIHKAAGGSSQKPEPRHNADAVSS